MKEIWKEIPGYENLYQVSNKGRIKSLYNYKSLMEAYRDSDIKSASNIVMCCYGKYKQAGGYIWKYKEVVSQ